MSRVFITHEPHRIENGEMKRQFDLTPAAAYGKLEVLIPAGVSLISSVPTVRLMRDRLANFTDDDYLLPVGDPSAMMVAGAIAADVNGGRFKVLRWDRKAHTYIPVQIDVYGKAV